MNAGGSCLNLLHTYCSRIVFTETNYPSTYSLPYKSACLVEKTPTSRKWNSSHKSWIIFHSIMSPSEFSYFVSFYPSTSVSLLPAYSSGSVENRGCISFGVHTFVTCIPTVEFNYWWTSWSYVDSVTVQRLGQRINVHFLRTRWYLRLTRKIVAFELPN